MAGDGKVDQHSPGDGVKAGQSQSRLQILFIYGSVFIDTNVVMELFVAVKERSGKYNA